MKYFVLMNNARKVWDYEAWRDACFPCLYWRFNELDFHDASISDRIILYVTSSTRKIQGVHFGAEITKKDERPVGRDFWRSGKQPAGPIKLVEFIIKTKVYHIKRDQLIAIDPHFTEKFKGAQGRSSLPLSKKIGDRIWSNLA